MAYLSDSDILDLVKGTLYEMGAPKFQQIAQPLQRYEIMSKWLKEDKIVVDDGIGIQRNLMTSLPGQARHKGMYAEDSLNIVNLLSQMQVPWRHADTGWGFDKKEVLMNSGKSLITKVITPRRVGAMIDLAREIEEKAWSAPSATNSTLPWGIPYWVVSNASEGFNGGLPSGFSTVAGIDPTSLANWKNYTGTYTNITKADLLTKLRTAVYSMGFVSPISDADMKMPKFDRQIYTNLTVILGLENVGEAQNENLGRDLAPYVADKGGRDLKDVNGMLTFRRIPITYVPQLDSDPASIADAIYLIDHSTFNPVVLDGVYLRESEPRIASHQHTTVEMWTDISYNFICTDRRANGVFYYA